MAAARAKTNLPGQAMDLDVVSDGEQAGEDDNGDGITASMLKALFADQTAELKSCYRGEMQEAIKACEGRLTQKVETVKDDLVAQITATKEKLAKMGTNLETVEARMEKIGEKAGWQAGPATRPRARSSVRGLESRHQEVTDPV